MTRNITLANGGIKLIDNDTLYAHPQNKFKSGNEL